VAKIVARLVIGEYGDKYILLKDLLPNQIENIQVALERKKLEESFRTTVDGLTIELGLAKAVTREEENRLKIQQKRLSLEGKGLDENQINQIVNSLVGVRVSLPLSLLPSGSIPGM